VRQATGTSDVFDEEPDLNSHQIKFIDNAFDSRNLVSRENSVMSEISGFKEIGIIDDK